MSPLADLPAWAALPVALLLVVGGVVVLVGALGLMRLPNFYQRIHGPAISMTLGAGCILIASMIYFTALQARLVIHELLIGAFIMLTAPVVAMLVMRAAVYRDLRAGRSVWEQDTTPPGNDRDGDARGGDDTVASRRSDRG